MKGGEAVRAAAVAAPFVVALGCASFPDATATRETAETMVSHSFTAPDPKLLTRLRQDRAQMICSKIGAAPLSNDEAAEVVSLSRAAMKYPASGKLIGDWKIGDRLAHDGAGDRIQYGALEKRPSNGGLCQNCHALEPAEINVGNVGPSLTGYGLQRGQSREVVKYTYEHIYNAWAFLPCSNMPRLGATGHLTADQVAHLVAYLVDSQSPLNRK